MLNETIGLSLILVFLGIVCISLGLTFTLGINRTWWRAYFLAVQEGYFWASIPIGIGWLFLAVAVWFPRGTLLRDIFFWGGIFVGLVGGTVCSLGPPKILKPKWLRDLEDRHPWYIVSRLRDRARQLTIEEWLAIVHDPVRLEQWADEEADKLSQ